jgi:hypothetical protein
MGKAPPEAIAWRNHAQAISQRLDATRIALLEFEIKLLY